MSPALGTIERIRRTEQVIAYLRFTIICFNIALYVILGPTGSRRGFALVVAVTAFIYALVTLVLRPQGDHTSLRAAYASMILDNFFIGVWVYATGGFDSPFYLLFYAHAAASIGRFGARIGGLAALAGGVVYLGVIIIDGGGPLYDVLARTGYVVLISAMVAYVAEVARTYERETAMAEEKAANYREIDRLRSTFVTNVSHELRTPLTVIRGAASTLVRNRDSLEAKDELALLDMIERQSTDLGNLVQDIIDAGLVEQGRLAVELGPTDVGELVHEQVALMRTRTSREIDYLPPSKPISANCDARKIANALRKTIDNALKFSSHNSKVSVRVGANEAEVQVIVDDEGIGIPEGDKERIFERFVQLDPSHTRSAEGTGIGLTIVRTVLELHGGSVDVAARPGGGSRFILRFPKRFEVSLPASDLEVTAT